ncbi:MAG: glycosyl hydrolase [Planctomycetes bacterium]|nr:glycosyl hydrolase [Planctomycetota bacterium]
MSALRRHALLGALLFASSFAASAVAQGPDPAGPVPDNLFDTLDWRLVGPFRGGRVAAVCGVVGDRNTYWFGGTGGGVWQSTDAGKSWRNVSDGTFGGSIGAVAVAPSDPRIVYVGTGEKTWRGNVSSGDGIWKTTDAGATWEFCGLPDARHTSRIRVHPQDPKVVFAAVMGHAFGPNDTRGVYRSVDGGQNWERVLFANEHAGAVDLCFGAEPKQLFATTWRAQRTPHSFTSGGEGSGLWQSNDGGTTWQPVHGRPGLPTGMLGISGIAVAPSRPSRVYALVEAEDGGLFVSDDSGATWQRRNEERNLRQRAWYYTRLYVDPKDADAVYVLNVEFLKSTDGGKTFAGIGVPHGDNHDLWIDPQDPLRMIEGNDGGACVTVDGGKSWTSLENQPTAQFYRITTDTATPYRIYGCQQDNSSVRIRHLSRGDGIGRADWESTAGGECGWLAPKPDDPDVVFGGNYGGYLQRYDHRTGLSRNVSVWPDSPIGAGAGEQRYRFQWNFPLQWSRHERGVLYAAAQVLFRSTDEGTSWQAISGDLTRNDPNTLGASGGPITKDNTGVEYYATIFAFDEGRQPGTLWCGSDDGRVHVTRDGGRNWQDVTPPELPEWAQINCIRHDPHRDGGCYLAATRYKLDDQRPYLFVTDDFGATWRLCTGGLDAQWFTRCICPDPVRPGLLYCGTERTVWISFDDGRRWQKFQHGLPLVPITDLCVRDDALLAATQGRSFWSFDGLAHVRSLSAEQALLPLHVFAPVAAETAVGGDGEVAGKGRNPARRLQVRFWVGGAADAAIGERLAIEVVDPLGAVVCRRASDASDGKEKCSVRRGMNHVAFEWTDEAPKILDGMVLWHGRGAAPRPAPGDYTIRVTLGETTQAVQGRLRRDPRSTASDAELQERRRLSVQCRDAVTKAHTAIEQLRSVRTQLQAVVDRAEGDAKSQLEALRAAIATELTAVEEALLQTKAKSSQDVLNFPIRLTDKLLGVQGAVESAEFGPTAGQREVADSLIAAIETQLATLERTRGERLGAFNALARELAVPHVK